MRFFHSLVFSVCILQLSFGQTNPETKFPPFPPDPSDANIPTVSVYTFVEQNPEFPGGDTALIKFLQQNIVYPTKELDSHIQGKVLVRFIVNEDGHVSDAYVAKGVNPALDAEALRVINMLPNFKAGKMQGKPIKAYFNLPIVFKLPQNQENDPKSPEGIKENLTNEKLLRDKDFNAALLSVKTGDLKEALKYLTTSIKNYPNDYLAYELKAECELQLKNSEDACKDFRLALKAGSPAAQDLLNKNCK